MPTTQWMSLVRMEWILGANRCGSKQAYSRKFWGLAKSSKRPCATTRRWYSRSGRIVVEEYPHKWDCERFSEGEGAHSGGWCSHFSCHRADSHPDHGTDRKTLLDIKPFTLGDIDRSNCELHQEPRQSNFGGDRWCRIAHANLANLVIALLCKLQPVLKELWFLFLCSNNLTSFPTL